MIDLAFAGLAVLLALTVGRVFLRAKPATKKAPITKEVAEEETV